MNDSGLAAEAIYPASVEELLDVVRSEESLVAVGNQTKSDLLQNRSGRRVSISKLNGMLDYQPSEFTFTALAGTTLKELSETLAKNNQYLPFDPPLVESGATIGGTVAVGLSGPGRQRFGGVRDFVLGMQLVLSDGEAVRVGGKVVKNAAGFDIPKLMVGSLGRLGLITEVTFKVFPKPQSELTIGVKCLGHSDAVERMSWLAKSRFELDAIDYRASERTIYARLRGQENANAELANAIRGELQSDSFAVMDDAASRSFWTDFNEWNWFGCDACLVKIPVDRELSRSLHDWCDQTKSGEVHWSAAGSVAWVAVQREGLIGLHGELCKCEAKGLVVRGKTDRIELGVREPQAIESRIKQAMDPRNRFG